VEQHYQELETLVPLQTLLGYLNFSEGKPDARFQKQLNDAYGFLAEHRAPEPPWKALFELLQARLSKLRDEGSSAFRDTRQAEAVLSLALVQFLPVYRQHHADLLFHRSDAELFQPFFLARVVEAVLIQGPPWDDEKRILGGSLNQLNDFVGHRPIAILETRPKAEPYEHERVRPIPVFLRGAGAAWGPYHALVSKALEILATTPQSILTEAYLDPELLDELALDPRAYDHGHPVNRRPNYVFGEWDPHHLDNQARYRRYVARHITFDALLDRVTHPGDLDPAEVLFEAAAVFVGTMLMATGTSGSGPSTHESTTTLATLMPLIARYRDAFYTHLLEEMTGAHGIRLRKEASATRQPFGGARQHLNQYLAQHRATQLQQRQLALLFAEMGYPEASQRAAARIPAASVRLLSEILGRLATGQLLVGRGQLAKAAPLLPEAESLLRHGIACGAFVDPWNILGFQGLFPLFAAREDSIRDGRIDELVHAIEQIFNLYSRLVSEAAALGEQSLNETLLANLRHLGLWWDRFASVEVSEVRHVHGAETVASAEHVATALARWHDRGETSADLAFWRDHLEGFHSPKAFALVVDALLHKNDYRAAMALLMNWLGQTEQVTLEDGDYSFHTLAVRWMLGLTASPQTPSVAQGEEKPAPAAEGDIWPLVSKFFDYLEANADEYWQVPTLDLDEASAETESDEEEESLYSAAYSGVTFRDSADDEEEGSVAEGGSLGEDFDLEFASATLVQRLRFLSTVARLWLIAGHQLGGKPTRGQEEVLAGWLNSARDNQQKLLGLLDAIQAVRIPEPLGSHDSLVEYDRRRGVKEQLLYTAISTCLDTSLAEGSLQGILASQSNSKTATGAKKPDPDRPAWKHLAIQLEQALLHGDAERVRALLPPFRDRFQEEPLLFTALADGGHPRQILRVRLAQSILRSLSTSLPRLGLLRETFHLLRSARAMELAHPPGGRGVTEFNHLFQSAYQAVVEAVVDTADMRSASPGRDQELVDLLETMTRPFLALWVEHSQTLQLSALDSITNDEDWRHLREFVQRYGSDLFHAKFMTLANLRSILHRGVGSYLDYLGENPDPLHPVQLIDDLDHGIPRTEAVRWLQVILQTLVENYEEYKDYNTTTPQSDYGENLHLLLEFLRLKIQYERHAWRLRPLVLAHEVLARKKRLDLAVSWEEAYGRLTQDLAAQYQEKLAELEKTNGMRLRTVADRLGERFVKPLALDRLCALIEPAMLEARRLEKGKSFIRLEKELQPLTAVPTGVGLDVPEWLRRLEAEVVRVRTAHTNLAVLAEGFSRVPRKVLSLEDLKRQLADWEKPLASE
jgi:hypothetical protein